MDAAGEFDIQALFNGLEKIHDQVMRDVKSSQRHHVLVIRPVAFDQDRVQPFLLEETFFNRHVNGRFAGQADITHPDFYQAVATGGGNRAFLALLATAQQQAAQQ